jgi:dipeptidyl aminopeptidase/acylaminoacyl peptidase
LVTRYDAFRGVLGAVDASAANEAELVPLFGGKPGLAWGAFSPDGRSIAYTSDETGREEVYLSGWDAGAKKPTGRPVQVSSAGGSLPRWSRDSSRLFFQTPENKILGAAVSRGPGHPGSPPVLAWDLDQIGAAVEMGAPLYDLLPDGSLLVIRRGAEEDDVTRYEVALNFDEEVKAKFRK